MTNQSSKSKTSSNAFRRMICCISIVVATTGSNAVKAMNACGNGNSEKVDVVIVGAGLAGLFAAAKINEKKEISYKILEASSILGGRFQSEESDFTNDKNEQLTLEMGGQFMLGKRRNNVAARSNPMFELFDGYKYNFVDYSLLNSFDAYKVGGKTYPDRSIRNKATRFSRVSRKCFDKSGIDYEDQFYNPNRYDEDEKEDKNVLQVLSECSTNYELDTAIRWALAHNFIVQELGVALNDTSRASFPESSLDVFTEEGYIFNDVRGSSALVKEFAENHVNEHNIVYNANVTSVKNYNAAGGKTTTTAIITNADGSECSQEYESSYSIVTSPMNVLRSGAIDFENDMVSVLNSHPIAQNKVEIAWVQFDEVFWDIEKDFLLVTQDVNSTTGAAIYFYNYEKSHPGSKMLMTFVVDEQIEKMGGIKMNILLSGLLELPSYDESNKYITKQTDWRGNANTRGAWEQWQLGKTYGDWYDAYGPLTNLHLAGSAHCLEFWGFTWGAVINGIYNGEFVVNRILYPDETLDYQEPYSPCDADASYTKEFRRFYRGSRHLFKPKS